MFDSMRVYLYMIRHTNCLLLSLIFVLTLNIFSLLFICWAELSLLRRLKQER